MREFLCVLMVFILTISVFGCAMAPAAGPTETTSIIETEDDSLYEAYRVLNECGETQVWHESFIPTIIAQVPDVANLVEIRCSCWTYFLVMSDGTEFIVTTDQDMFIIQSIYYWEDGQNGALVYELEE